MPGTWHLAHATRRSARTLRPSSQRPKTRLRPSSQRPKTRLRPSKLLGLSKLLGPRALLQALLSALVLSGALTYSPGTSVGASIGLKVGSLNFGYAYEMYTSAIGAESGTHELMVGYSLDLSKFKKSRNLHKSIRIL